MQISGNNYKNLGLYSERNEKPGRVLNKRFMF